MIGVAFLHESPKYLISKGKEEEASKALRFYRGPLYDITSEMDELRLQDLEDKRTGRISPRTLLSKRVYLQPFLLVLMLMFVQQAGGVNVVSFYIQVIFEDAGSDLDPGRCFHA